MRSQRDYIVTKDEVYGYANEWLTSALRLEYEGTKCTTSTLFAVLLIAASRVVSIFAGLSVMTFWTFLREFSPFESFGSKTRRVGLASSLDSGVSGS